MNSDGESRDAYRARFESWLVEALEEGDRDEVVVSVVALVGQLVDRVIEAELRLALERAAHSGRRTERLNPTQRSLMLALLGEDESAANDDEVNAIDEELVVSEREAEEARRSESRSKPKRSALPAHLPREDHDHRLSDEHCTCATCERPLSYLGDDESEMLAIIPARFVVKRDRVAKYACGYCKNGVMTAPRPPKPVSTPALQAQGHRPPVAYPLKLIAMLYSIERRATPDGLDWRARTRRRTEDSAAVLKRLVAWYVRTAAREPPASARTVVLHGADPQAYLTDVLTRLADPNGTCDIADLLPDAWGARHGNRNPDLEAA